MVAHLQPSCSADNSRLAGQATPQQQRALPMLDSLFEATNDLPDDLTKVYLQRRIADTLWDYDESRARSRFERALLTANSIKAPPGSLPKEKNNLRVQYRGDVLASIKQRDPQLAKKLALDYLDKANPDIWTIELFIDVDRQYATHMIRHCIDTSNTAWLDRLLRKLRATDPISADDLFTHALSVAEQRSKEPFSDFGGLFRYVFPSETGNFIGFNLHADTSPAKPELIKRFLDFGCKALIQEANAIEQESRKNTEINERSGYGYMELQMLLPFFDQYAPASAAKIRARWDEVILNLRGGKEHIRQARLLFAPMNTQEILGNAEHAKDEIEKQVLYGRAAKQASTEGDFEEAFLILSRIPAAIREDLEATIRAQAAKAAIARSDVDASLSYAKGIEDLRERTDLIERIVRLLYDQKDPERAMKVLNEALEIAKKAENNWLKPGAMLNIASAATLLNPARGFEVMNQAVEVINNAKDFAQNITDFDQNLLLLAPIDFDRALMLTEKLSGKESRLIAQTAVCRGILVQK